MPTPGNTVFLNAVPQKAKHSAIASERGVADKDLSSSELPLAGTRVLFVVPQPFYEDRGSPIAVLNVLRAMSELGMHVDMLAFSSGQSVELPNLRIFRCGKALRIRHVPIGFSIKKVLLDIALLFAVRARLKTEQYTCVHALEDGIYVALAAGAHRRVPVIYDMHSCIPEQLSKHPLFSNRLAQWGLNKFERFALRQSKTISCSVGLKGYIEARAAKVPVAEWTFCDPNNDIDVQEFREPVRFLREKLGIDRNACVILYAGNFEGYQGVGILVDSMSFVRQVHPDAILVLVGATADDNIEELVKRGDSAVIICPRQPHDMVGIYLQMAQVLVSPRTAGDNLPLKLFEYLAAGKPIVATDNMHHRMVLSEGRAVFANSTPEGLASAITQLLESPATMERLATAAKAYAVQELGWSNFVRSVSTLYKSTL